jgi:hypothetical protein
MLGNIQAIARDNRHFITAGGMRGITRSFINLARSDPGAPQDCSPLLTLCRKAWLIIGEGKSVRTTEPSFEDVFGIVLGSY